MNEGLTVRQLKEHDAIEMHNPTAEDFSWRFNGELYTILAGERKSFSKFVAFHLAKHLSTKMVVEDAEKGVSKKALEDRTNPIHSQISQLNVYDTPERRIALYKIFENRDLVESVILKYPFKGLIGDMKLYDIFIEKAEKSKAALEETK